MTSRSRCASDGKCWILFDSLWAEQACAALVVVAVTACGSAPSPDDGPVLAGIGAAAGAAGTMAGSGGLPGGAGGHAGTAATGGSSGSGGAGGTLATGGAAGAGGIAGAAGAGGAPPAQAPVGCVTTVVTGHHVFPCGGLSFDVEVPTQCAGASCGVVLDVHGGSMSAAQEDNNTRMRELGRLHGYVVIQPNAMGGMYREGVDDVALHQFLLDAMASFAIDEKRVHVTGFSQGGFMTWRFICNHAALIASAAPGAAGVGGAFEGNGCAFAGAQMPQAPMAILHLQGRRDALVKYERGLAQRDAVISGWGMGSPTVVAGDATFTRTRWVNTQGAVYEFLDHDYSTDAGFLGIFLGGHCYPGSMDHSPSEPGQLMGYGCKGANSFHWGNDVMQFFIANPKP